MRILGTKKKRRHIKKQIANDKHRPQTLIMFNIKSKQVNTPTR